MIADRDRDGKPFTVVCCSSCGLARVEPLPSQDALARFYAERYRLEYKQASRPSGRHIVRAGRIAAERLGVLRQLLPNGGRLLDCGAGGGEFVYLAGRNGFSATGIEPNDGYREFARQEYGTDMRAGTVQDHGFDAGSFDAITMFHVLEHVIDPIETLRTLRDWLRPGGVLLIEVPNAITAVSSPANLYHAAHLYYFSAGPLTALARRAGFETVFAEGAAERANLLAAFRKPGAGESTDVAAPVDAAPGDHDRVVDANRRRTLARYLASPLTWTRGWQRLAARGEERRSSERANSARELLDAIDARTQELPR